MRFPYHLATLPHHPCTACGAGDATRMMLVAGQPEWLAAGLEILASVEARTATQMVEDNWSDLQECGQGRRALFVRLCRACARRAVERMPGVKVYSAAKFDRGEYDGQPLYGLTQADAR